MKPGVPHRGCAWARLALALGWLAAGGCGDDSGVATYVQPVYGEPCRFIDCGPGECRAAADGQPECLCEPGYRGAYCETCEEAFHRDHLDRCLPDARCADQPQNPCGRHGQCDDSDGVVACLCDEGYEGPRCTLCEDRHGRDALGRCLPILLGAQGGELEEPGAGCADGYTGADCTVCASGYHAFGPGCVLDEVCTDGSCPPNADCRVLEGQTSCLCRPGYSGLDCNACASGLHAAGGACVPDEVCVDGSCAAHASCSVTDGSLACTCSAGYTGSECDSCDVGYHADATGCEPDQTCSPLSCSARATCVVVQGDARCDCDPGWGGALCDRCIDLGTEIISFEGAQDWPTVANTCTTRSELWVPRLSLRSRAGAEPLLVCASNTYSGLTSQHVELRAGQATPAASPLPTELVFWQPVVMVSFDYAASLQGLALDVFADGRKVGALDTPALSRSSFTVALDPPATGMSLVSRDGTLQSFGLDNIVFNYERCR